MTASGGTSESPISASRMVAAFDCSLIATLVLDTDGRIEAANAAAESLFGCPIGPLPGRHFVDVVSETAGADAQSVFGDVQHVAGLEIERRLQHVDRRTGQIPLGSGTGSMWLANLSDGAALVQIADSQHRQPGLVTQQQQRAFRAALLELGELSHTQEDDAVFYDTLLTRAVSVVPGAQGGSITVRRTGTDEFDFVAAHGYDLAALQTRCLRQSGMFHDAGTPEATINHNLTSQTWSDEERTWMATVGRIHDIAVNISAPVFIGGSLVAFVSLDNFDDRDAFSETSVEMTTVLGRLIADLLHRRELEAELRNERESFKHLALHDELTGLANRRQIETALEESDAASKSQGTPLAVFFVDIDDFKEINDQFGHEVGDHVIVAVADALNRATRPDDLVGRWGGDEFMVIARGVPSQKEIEAIAHRMLAVFDGDLVLADGRKVNCRLSIGAAWSPDGSIDADRLVRNADGALYEAKSAGKYNLRVAS